MSSVADAASRPNAVIGSLVLIAIGLLAPAGCVAETPMTDSATLQLGPHRPARVRNAHVVGRVAPDRMIDLVLGLRLRDRAGLDELLTRQSDPRSADHRRYLSPAAFAALFAPSAAEYEALAATLERAGLTVTRRVAGRTALSLRGPAARIEQLFSTDLEEYEDDAPRGARSVSSGESRFYAPSQRFVLDAALSVVESVSGLDDADRWLSHRHGPHPGDGADPNALPNGSAEPADLRALYGATGALHPTTNQPLLGTGETIAILGTGYAPEDADIKNFITRYALPTNQRAQYVRVYLGGDNRDPDALAQIEYGENVLDADMVLAMAPLANVVHVHTATNAPGLFADGVSFIVNQVPQAHAVSVSYGSCERVSIYETLQMNVLLAQAKAQGQAWFIASGDNGTDGCRDASPNAVPSVDWPASSTYVFGVGGTELSAGVEVVWGPGGGGQSELFEKPLWQQGIGPLPNDGVRQVPDVAALSGEPGVATVFGNSVYPSMGTSAAAPIWAGVWALLDEARGGAGMADYHERVYGLGGVGFRDITSGKNSDGTTPGFPALPGFDLATGWGSPDVAALVVALP